MPSTHTHTETPTHTHTGNWARFVNERIVEHQHRRTLSHQYERGVRVCVRELWAGKINETQKRVYAIRTKITTTTTAAARL